MDKGAAGRAVGVAVAWTVCVGLFAATKLGGWNPAVVVLGEETFPGELAAWSAMVRGVGVVLVALAAVAALGVRVMMGSVLATAGALVAVYGGVLGSLKPELAEKIETGVFGVVSLVAAVAGGRAIALARAKNAKPKRAAVVAAGTPAQASTPAAAPKPVAPRTPASATSMPLSLIHI